VTGSRLRFLAQPAGAHRTAVSRNAARSRWLPEPDDGSAA